MEPPRSTPRLQSAAAVLPLLGLFLLMPPFILLFTSARAVLGIPLVVLYIFGVWAVLLAASWRLARRLGSAADGGTPGTLQPPGER